MVETIATDQQQNARKIRDEIRDAKTPRIIQKKYKKDVLGTQRSLTRLGWAYLALWRASVASELRDKTRLIGTPTSQPT